MKQKLKTVIFAFAAIMMICLVSNSASAQSNGLMKALNVNGQAKTITYDEGVFNFTKAGKCSDATYYDGVTTLGSYDVHSEFIIEIKNNKMVSMGANAQGSGWEIKFTAYDANNRPIKADLYSDAELSKRGAKISYSGSDAKGSWTKMIIDKSGASGGIPEWIPSSIKRTIKYW